MVHKPRTVVLIAPTDMPPQDTYRAKFIAHLRKQFIPEIVYPEKQLHMDTLRDGLRYAMEHAEQAFVGRNDLEYAAFVLPTFIARGGSQPPEDNPVPVVAITIRSWQCTEWVVPYAIQPVVPMLVLAEIADSISTVMMERNSREARDHEEKVAVAKLINGICKGINSALDEVSIGM